MMDLSIKYCMARFVIYKTEGKAKSKMGRWCEEWFEEDGGDQLETKDAGEETMERNNWANLNSQRVVELKQEVRDLVTKPSNTVNLRQKTFTSSYQNTHTPNMFQHNSYLLV
jgi:hypothetical protein